MSKFEDCITLIKNKIASGEWSPGMWLPSQAEWEKTYGVKYGTLRSAYIVLKSEGVIQGRQGDGVFVAGAEPTTPSKSGGRGRNKTLVQDPSHTYLDAAGLVQYNEGHHHGDGCIRRYGA